MAAKKVGALIKKARTEAGLTQEQLAKKVSGATASDISKAERGEKELTTDQLKAIAKATGVTQKSLLEAAGKSGASAKTSSAAAKTSASAKGASSGKTSSSGKTGSTASSLKLTATEKTLVELYRAADAATKKQVMNQLKGKSTETADLIKNVIGSAVSQMIKNGTK